eukprot:763059-Hanusia_phi.AAC.3
MNGMRCKGVITMRNNEDKDEVEGQGQGEGQDGSGFRQIDEYDNEKEMIIRNKMRIGNDHEKEDGEEGQGNRPSTSKRIRTQGTRARRKKR